jgi:hypothetical protein
MGSTPKRSQTYRRCLGLADFELVQEPFPSEFRVPSETRRESGDAMSDRN